MSVRALVDRMREMAKEEAGHATPARRYFVVVDADPLQIRDTASDDILEEEDDDFDLSGYAAFYHQNVGLEEGDLLLCHPVDSGRGETVWVATSVTTDNDHPTIPPAESG